MKVLQIIDSLQGSGGAERSLAALAPWLIDAGVDVELVVLRERDGLAPALRNAGILVVSVDRPGGRAERVRILRRLIRTRRPDLVHTTLFEADIAGRIAAWLARVPVVSSLVNVPYGPEHRATPGIRVHRLQAAHAVDAATAQVVSRFHATNVETADVMARRLLVPRTRIEVIPRGRDNAAMGRRSEERAAKSRADLGVGDAPLVVTAARHEYQKGLDVLIRAVPQVLRAVPDVRIVIAGRDGNHTESLRALAGAREVRERVMILGERDDVPELLAAADAYVLPSRWEGIAGVLLEAMALEAPVVATRLPGPMQLLQQGRTALFCEPDDVASLAGAIVQTLVEPVEARERAIAARAEFEHWFTMEVVVGQMAAFYDRALGRGAAASLEVAPGAGR